jgi:hypothetical protein
MRRFFSFRGQKIGERELPDDGDEDRESGVLTGMVMERRR